MTKTRHISKHCTDYIFSKIVILSLEAVDIVVSTTVCLLWGSFLSELFGDFIGLVSKLG